VPCRRRSTFADATISKQTAAIINLGATQMAKQTKFSKIVDEDRYATLNRIEMLYILHWFERHPLLKFAAELYVDRRAGRPWPNLVYVRNRT
jgi:hypothetical protein